MHQKVIWAFWHGKNGGIPKGAWNAFWIYLNFRSLKYMLKIYFFFLHWIFHCIFTIRPGYSVRCFSHIFSHLEGWGKVLIDYNHLHIWNFIISYAWHIQIKHINTIDGKHIGFIFYWSCLLSVLYPPWNCNFIKKGFFYSHWLEW